MPASRAVSLLDAGVRIAELEAENAELRRQLADRPSRELAAVLAHALDLTLLQGMVVAALYRARRPLTGLDLDERCPPLHVGERDSPEAFFRVVVCQIRRQLSPDAILCRRGLGYTLGTVLRKRCAMLAVHSRVSGQHEGVVCQVMNR